MLRFGLRGYAGSADALRELLKVSGGGAGKKAAGGRVGQHSRFQRAPERPSGGLRPGQLERLLPGVAGKPGRRQAARVPETLGLAAGVSQLSSLLQPRSRAGPSSSPAFFREYPFTTGSLRAREAVQRVIDQVLVHLNPGRVRYVCDDKIATLPLRKILGDLDLGTHGLQLIGGEEPGVKRIGIDSCVRSFSELLANERMGAMADNQTVRKMMKEEAKRLQKSSAKTVRVLWTILAGDLAVKMSEVERYRLKGHAVELHLERKQVRGQRQENVSKLELQKRAEVWAGVERALAGVEYSHEGQVETTMVVRVAGTEVAGKEKKKKWVKRG